jgi:hypothetical protein
MSSITFEAKLVKIDSWTLLRLPKEASIKLPSRGIVMVEGTLNGYKFQAPLEPDGKGSHWIEMDKSLQEITKSKLDDTVKVEITPTKDWPEPKIPNDLKKALAATPQALALWQDITPMARWDWIRWINSTKNPATRQKRITVTFSKFKDGKRRPCCFNRSECTVPDVSKSGVLLDPTYTTN